MTKDGREPIYARISPELYKALNIKAARNGTKLYEEIEEALRRYLKEEKK